jgi:hypothetical protein
MQRFAALVFSYELTTYRGNYFSNLVAVVASRHECAELEEG